MISFKTKVRWQHGVLAVITLAPATAAQAQLPHYKDFDLKLRSNLCTNEPSGYNLPCNVFFNAGTASINDDGAMAIRLDVLGSSQGVWFSDKDGGSIVYTSPAGASIGDASVNSAGLVVFPQNFSAQNGIYFYESASQVGGLLTNLPIGATGWDFVTVNDLGQVAFRTTIGGSGRAYYSLDDGATLALHAAEAGVDPKSPFSFLFPPAFNNNRQIAAHVRLGAPGQIGGSQPDEIRIFNSDGTSIIIARDVDADPSSPFAGFDATRPALTDDGHVSFIADLVEGGRGVFITTDAAPFTRGLNWDQVPRVFASNRALFRKALLHANETASDITVFGDSTSALDVSGGDIHFNHMLYTWWQYHGHIPRTPFVGTFSNSAAIVGNRFLCSNRSYGLGASPQLIASDRSLPCWLGTDGTGYSAKIGGTFNDPDLDYQFNGGRYVRLNHGNFNNHSSVVNDPDVESDYGYLHEASHNDLGEAGFASPNVLGGKSIMDLNSGLRLEVVAMRFQNAANDNATGIDVHVRPLKDLEGLQLDDEIYGTDAPRTEMFSLFGGVQSLRGPQGVAYKAQTPDLAPLEPGRVQYSLQVGGNVYDSMIVDDRGAQFDCRFVVGNQAGVSMWSCSRGGMKAGWMSATSGAPGQWYSNSGYVLEAIGSNIAWYALGLNNRWIDSPEQFKAKVLADCEFLFAHGYQLIILDCQPEPTTGLENFDFYPGVMYEIAQADERVMVVNSRRILEEDYNWNPQNHTADGLHPSAYGARAWAKSSIEEIIQYSSALSDEFITIANTNTPGVSDIDSISPVVNEEGFVAFRGKDNSDPPRQAIFLTDGVAKRRVVRQFDQVQTDLGLAQIAQHDSSSVFAASIDMNNRGDIAFNAALTPAGDAQVEWGNGLFVAIADTVPADLNGDHHVNVPDLLIVLNAWGTCPAPPTLCPADIAPEPNGDGVVNVFDLLMVITNWG